MDTPTKIKTLSEAFVADITAMIQTAALEAATLALGGDLVVTSRIRVRHRAEENIAPSTQALHESICTFVKANPGSRAGDICGALDITRARWTNACVWLCAHKRLVMKGTRRTATYTVPA